jgi:DNA ligase-1
MDYLTLVEFYDKLEKTSKRLKKTHILSQLFKKTPNEDLEFIAFLVQGRIFPPWDKKEIGISSRIIIKVLSSVTGESPSNIENLWRNLGDLGEVAKELIQKNKQRTLTTHKLTVKKVIENLRKLSSLEGKGTVTRKIQLVSELLTSANPLEAKFIIKNILGTLRVGVAEGILRDAIVWTFFGEKIKFKYNEKENTFEVNREEYQKYIDEVQKAYDLTNDFAKVMLTAKKSLKDLSKIKIQPGKPLNTMLYQKAEDIKDAFKAVGKPCAFEYKYDGIRLQLSKDEKGNIILFTRRLEDVSEQFPEVIDYVKKHIKGKEFILESEAVSYDPKTKKYLSFQNISQRIKRKYNIHEIAKKFPVEINIFDIMYYEGKNLLNTPFKERRKILEEIITPKKLKLRLAKQLITDNEKKAQEFFNESLAKGEEGVMAKNLDGLYKPGSRVGYGVKIKPSADTFDLVIVKAEWGEGKRSKWLSSFTISCKNNNEFLEIGKVSTGLKEKSEGVSFEELTNLLKPLIIKEQGRNVSVKPEIIIEVGYAEIQKSPTYSSGYALRFPRFISLRIDKNLSEVTTLEDINSDYKKQKK